jgi:hypothetical protein
VPAAHVFPAQQPVAQFCALHVPPATHAWLMHEFPVAQTAHVEPPLPHAAEPMPGMHVPFWQQPLGQF